MTMTTNRQPPNHTPGPWRVGRYQFRKHGSTITRAAVLQENSNYYITTDVCGGELSTAANARLIAAAPELLEALRAVEWESYNGVEYYCPWCGNKSREKNGSHKPNCQRQAAIAKATS